MDPANPLNQAPQVAAVSVKPPPFYRRQPGVWFRQLECQFALAKITNDQVKFYHALANLPEDLAATVPENEETYATLKQTVLDSFQANLHVRIEEALSGFSLQERRPSLAIQDLNRKLSEVGLDVDDKILNSRLLMALPIAARAALVTLADTATTDQFARTADAVIAVSTANSDSQRFLRNKLLRPTQPSFSQPR